MSRVRGALGRSFFEVTKVSDVVSDRIQLALFPRHWIEQCLPHDGEKSGLGQPSKQREAIKHPSSDYISLLYRNSREVKFQLLIGTSDDAVYLVPSDIYKPGLSDTGQTVVTRHVHYHVPHVLCLPVDTVYSDATLDTKKEGIIGIPRIDSHLIFIHRFHFHLIDLSIVPSLQQYFTHMIPLTSVKFDKDLRAHLLPPGTCIADFSAVYATAFRYRAPPYRVLLQDTTVPILRCQDECRTCRKQQNPQDVVKLRICSRYTKEDRKARALYCGEAC
ncbi:hypothetical protein ARMGADRAFT_1028503 [Armillaria gallica]|uniref:Uncharacterized protein n=1 Tax=Armillaria gallica TaxID=47427 RepID=A0A2H3DMI7_ARMGA|nr:hypothetical protein ARMGADRAFT_1028503 [Armillaria gallica]